MKNESTILNGEFSSSLLDKCKYEAQINDIINISVKNIYKSKEVTEKEIAGHQVLNQLLSTFTNAVIHYQENTLSNYDQLILRLLPETVILSKTSIYENMMAVCLFISKLSDSKAIRLYQKINGNSYI